MNATVEESSHPRLMQGLAAVIVIGASVAYSFYLTSFLDAKVLLLAVTTPWLALAYALRRDPLTLPGSFAPVLAAVAIAAVLQPWATSAVAAYSIEWSVRTALIALTAVLLANAFPSDSYRIEYLIAGSAVTVSAIALAQYAGLLQWWFPEFPYYPQRMYSVFGNQDLLGGYAAVGCVLVAALHVRATRRSWLLLAGLGILFAALFLSASRSAWLAAAIGLTVVILRSSDRRRVGVALGLAAVLAILASIVAPDSTIQRVSDTFSERDFGGRARLWFWDGTLGMMADQPVLGVGAGNFQYESPSYLGNALYASGPNGHVSNHVHTLHAHSDFLEVSAEFGLLGVGLGLWFLIRMPWRDAVIGAPLVAYLVFAALNTTLHSPAHVLALLLLAAAGERRCPRPAGARVTSSAVRWSATVLVTLMAALAIVMLVWPSALLAAARDAYEKESNRTVAAYDRAVRFLWPEYNADLERGILAAHAGQHGDALFYTERALQGLDTGEVHLLRAQQYERVFRLDEAKASYEAVVSRWPRFVGGWRGLVRCAPVEEVDEIVTRAEPWLGERAIARLRSLADRRKASDPSA